MATPTPEEQIVFITNVQRILDEGSFVATYKFALILTLADYCVRFGEDDGEALQLKTHNLAESFVEYYWRQAMPYPSSRCGEETSVLKQGASKQAAIINWIDTARKAANSSIVTAKANRKAWTSLKNKVANKIEEMPLWKLQLVGSSHIEIFFDQTGTGNEIRLRPGAVYCMRKFYDLIRNLVEGAWIRHVRILNANLLGESDLGQFLFGSERTLVSSLRPVFKDVQSNNCFYCGSALREGGDIDHFVPWSRYPLDLGHNFVLAHSACNRSKRDFLAASHHLDKWHKRNLVFGKSLGHEFESRGVLHNLEATQKIAIWAYAQAESAGANLWIQKDDLSPIDQSWRRIIA